VINKIDHYSVSSMQLAANCPRAFWAKYILKKEQASSDAASFGSQYDQQVSARLGCKIHKAENPASRVVEGVDEAVAGYLCQPHALKTATDAQVPINISPLQWQLMAEIHGFHAEIQKPIIGFIDLWDAKNRVIVDLKTSASKRTSPGWALQVLIYTLAQQANEAKIHLMTRTKTPAYYEYIVPISKQSLAWAMHWFTHQANMVERWLADGCGECLPRNADYYCNWCAEQLECPATNIILGG
jgi:hypothetical protein